MMPWVSERMMGIAWLEGGGEVCSLGYLEGTTFIAGLGSPAESGLCMCVCVGGGEGGGGVHVPYCHSRAHTRTARADQPPWKLGRMQRLPGGDVMASYQCAGGIVW